MSKSLRLNRKRRKKKDKVIIRCIVFIIICLVGIGAYYYFNNDDSVVKMKTRKLKIVDENSNKRPIAVMIDNNIGNNSHVGLQDSYINYEIIVEGGLTRIMAIYKDKDVSTIGPVRSSRHYFLDYAMESDAIYAHYGWSDFAKNDISALNINNINGLYDENAYWRDKAIASPHNVFTSTDTLYKYAKSEKDYNVTTDDWKLLNYSVKAIKTSEEDEKCNSVSIKYSNYQTTSYDYDSDAKYYLRSMDGNKHIDKTTGAQLHYKNIIIEKVENKTIDSYGRQDLDTVGSGEGFYITNGYVWPITWSKDSRGAKTVYTKENGNKLKVNDGNTFIQIVPTTAEVTIN